MGAEHSTRRDLNAGGLDYEPCQCNIDDIRVHNLFYSEQSKRCPCQYQR